MQIVKLITKNYQIPIHHTFTAILSFSYELRTDIAADLDTCLERCWEK